MGKTQAHFSEALQQPTVQRRTQRYAAGDLLFTEGDASDGIYIILSGQLKVYMTHPSGREMTCNLLDPGELFGELSLYGDPRSASVKAVTNAECMVITNSTARDLMHTRREFADHVIGKLITRARHASQMSRSVVMDGVPERVIALLESAALTDGIVRRIPAALTQQETADRIGASREMVHKGLGRLVREGYLHKDAKHRMTILKPLSNRDGGS